MRILQIIDSLPASSGGSRFVVNLTKKLNSLGLETALLLIDGKASYFTDEIERYNIELIALDKNTKSRYKVKYIAQIAKIMDEYDIIHVHVFPASYLVGVASGFSKKNTKIVFTEHSSYNRRASHSLFRYIEKFIYSRYSHIVCLSAQVDAFVKKNLNTNDKKLSIIENAIDREVIEDANLYTKTALGYKEDDVLLLMTARLDQSKNHKTLIEAMQFLPPQVKLLLAGDGVLYKELLALSHQLKLENRVKFLGSRQDIFSLMKSVDINVLSSNFEGLSLAALEAMSSGKPFIASNVPGLDFVVNDSRLLFYNSSKDISETILRLINDKVWYTKAIEINQERALNFDFKIMTEKYINVYNKILNDK